METNHRVKYQPRSGTTNSGWDYETNMLTLLALRCVRQNFKNFWLGTNLDDVGDFDDAFLHIQESPKSNGLTFFIQLKHSKRTKEINEKDFMSAQKRNNDFSLVKYSGSFTKLKATLKSKSADLILNKIEPKSTMFVLFTNRTSVKHKFMENSSNKWFFLLNTHSSTKNIYKFNLTELDRSKLNNLDYCENIRLFSNQGDVNKLNNLIKGEVEKLTERMGVENVDVQAISDKFKDYVNDWARGELGGCFYLTKYDVEFKLGQLFLLQFVVNLNKECLHWSNDAKIWNDIIQDKKITVVDSDDQVVPFLKDCVGTDFKHYFDGTGKSWSYVLSNEQKKLLYKNTNLEVQMPDVIGNQEEITILDIYKCLAFHGELPILLEMNSIDEYSDILKIMKFSNNNFRAIIINNTSELVSDTSVKHFLTLCDLDIEERDKILDLRVKLQGRSSAVLRDLIDDNMYKFIKCSDIIYILLNIFNVGNTLTEYSNISECFIHRSLSKVMFKHEVFETVKNELFLVEHPDNTSRPSTSHNLNPEYDTRNLSYHRNLPNVINCKQNESAQEFEKLKSRVKVIHLLKSHNDYYYEWKETFGSVKTIRQHQLIQHNTLYEVDRNVQASPLDGRTFWIQLEDELKLGKGSDLPNKTYIIDGSPGMGKTTLLDFVAQHAPPNIWVFKINLSEHDEYFEEIQRTNAKLKTVDYIQYFKNTILQNCPNGKLAEMIADKLLDKKRVLYLIDGFDEIAISYKNEVTNLLKFLQGEGYPMWVTNRSITKDHLEKELNTISITLKPFVKNDQTTFLIKYFTQVCINNGNTTSYSTSTESLIEEFTNELLKAKDLSLIDTYSEFLGIPLQIKLLGEVFSEDCKNYLEDPKEVAFDHSIDLLHLYTKFIENKSDIFYKKNKKARLVRELFRTFENHRHLFALKILFSAEDLIELNIDKELEDYNEDKQKKLQFLLIEGVIEKDGSKSNRKLNVRFVHRTFAEYFAAQWLYLSIKSNNEKVKHTAIKLTRERLQRYRNYWFLFNIFDRMAADGKPLHLAIIDGKANEAKDMITSNPENANVVDECNRSVIHMAALYGINEQISNRDVNVVDHIVEVIDLVPDVHLWQMKDLVGYKPLYYALISERVGIANKICEKSKDLTLHNFIDFPNKQLYLAYCVSHNYKHLFELLFSHFLFGVTLLKNVHSIDSYYRYLCESNIHGVFLDHLPDTNYNLQNISKLSASILCPPNQYYTNLYLASAFGSKENVEDLIEEGCKVNQRDVYCNNTSLHYAIIHGRLEIVELLLSNGADVNKSACNDNTSLHYAVKTGNVTLVKRISEQTRSQIAKKDSDNKTPLYLAIINNNTEIAKSLLSEGATCNIEMDNDRNSYLHYACRIGNVDLTSSLLNKGGKVNSFNSFNQTPLHFAVEYNEVDIVKLLISHNADLDINDTKGYSPLHYAAEEGYTDVVEILLQASKDNQSNDDKLEYFQYSTETTPLHIATMNGYEDIVKLLLTFEKCNTEDRCGRSTLHHVSEANHNEVIPLLLSKNVDVNKQDNDGNTPIHLALRGGLKNIAEMLLKQCENINAKNSYGSSLLHFAVLTGNKEIVLDILSKGGDVNITNNMGMTPLHFLLFKLNRCYLDTIKLLLSKGADCNIADGLGKLSPLHWAVQYGKIMSVIWRIDPTLAHIRYDLTGVAFASERFEFQKLCVDLLLKSGANCNATDTDGNTPLHLANTDAHLACLLPTWPLIPDSLNAKKLLLNFREYVTNLLINSGADVNIRNNEGKTAMDLAKEVLYLERPYFVLHYKEHLEKLRETQLIEK